MKLEILRKQARRTAAAGFTLLEVMVGFAVAGVLFLGLYTGVSQGFAVIQLARENLRAVQVLQEKTETIRLYTWDQITTPGFIPSTFTAPFYAAGDHADEGFLYLGNVLIAPAPVDNSHQYANDLKQVVVTVRWTSGDVVRTRTMRTFVSKYGLFRYIY